jgi:hypothetical protein
MVAWKQNYVSIVLLFVNSFVVILIVILDQ